MGTTKKIVIEYEVGEAEARGLLGCSNCVKATGGQYSHPSNNHFDDGEGSCAHCACKKFKMKPKGGKLILPKKRKSKAVSDDIKYASENADMVSIIRRQVEEIGDPFTSIPFLDDCVAQVIQDRKEAREALTQVKVDLLDMGVLSKKTHALIRRAMRKS